MRRLNGTRWRQPGKKGLIKFPNRLAAGLLPLSLGPFYPVNVTLANRTATSVDITPGGGRMSLALNKVVPIGSRVRMQVTTTGRFIWRGSTDEGAVTGNTQYLDATPTGSVDVDFTITTEKPFLVFLVLSSTLPYSISNFSIVAGTP